MPVKMVAASVAALMLAPLAARATPLMFALQDSTGAPVVSFELDSSPTPQQSLRDYFVVSVTDAFVDGVADSALSTMSFADEQFGSVLSWTAGGTDYAAVSPDGSLFTGSTTAPQFAPQTFAMIDESNYQSETLTISAVSSAPEPSDWALMIAGIGVMGLALRCRSPQTARGRLRRT